MIKTIAGTFVSKILVILLTFGIVMVNTNILGREGVGQVALVNLAILIIVSMSNFFGGGAIVFLTPRLKPGLLLVPAYIWAFLVSFASYWIFLIVDQFPNDQALHLSVLGLLQSLFIFHFQVMVGKKRIKAYNILVTLQAAVLLVALLVFYFLFQEQTVTSFIWSLYFSFGLIWISSLAVAGKYFGEPSFKSFRQTAQTISRYGFFSELSNVLQILVRRATYIYAENIGTSFLGLYSVSVQLSETIKVIGNSMATVQYAEIANSANPLRDRLLTIRMFKVAVVTTSIVSFVIAILPDSVYTFVFGDEFGFLNDLLWWFLPAMIAMAMRAILSHHFSGKGLHHLNTIAAGIGIVTILPLGYFLAIDGAQESGEMGLVGLAIATSIGFSIQALFQIIAFARIEKVEFREFLIQSTDWFFLKRLIVKTMKAFKKSD